MSIIFNPSLITLNVTCQTADQAIEKSGALLLQSQLCTEAYIDAMKQVYHEFGAYIVLDNGIAMPHARPEDGALACGFSIITLQKPVYFQHQDFDPVSVVIAIASQDSSAHLTLMQIIANLIEHDVVQFAKQAKTQHGLFDFIQPFITDHN